jgi:chromosome partitioning protein
MGLLSRKSRSDRAQNGGPPTPAAEQLEQIEKEAPQPAPEVRQEKPQEGDVGTTQTEQVASDPAAPGNKGGAKQAEQGEDHPPAADSPPTGLDRASERDLRSGEGERAGAEQAGGNDDQRMRPEDLIAPQRRRPGEPEQGEQPSRGAQVIAFANQKGGVAKTTTTLNLAVAFKESGHEVLAIDLDPQGNLTMSQGIDPDKVEKSLFDVLVHDAPIREVIHEREIDIAVASIDLAGAEIAMSTKIGRERTLQKALRAVVGDYDFICIDTPPSLGLLTVNALAAADKVIVPVQCEYLSMRGLVQLQNTLKMIQENLNPDVKIEGILPTMLDARTVHAKEAVEILEENFGELVFKSRIRKAIKFAEAPVRGSSVLKYDPDGNAANYYRELAKEVLTNGSS